jgi:hypothetical protein
MNYTVDENGCWIWNRHKDRQGYGRITVNGKRGRSAYRHFYEERYGKIPQGLVLDHLCKVTSCVNPDHLEVVTVAENNRRSANCISTVNAKKTHCPNGHEYNERNTYVWRKRRHCRVCNKAAVNKIDVRDD